MTTVRLFSEIPILEFRLAFSNCLNCQHELKVLKTHERLVSTLHIGKFRAIEVVLKCPDCGKVYRSNELNQIVPPGANFGYDVMVYCGYALLLRSRSEEEVVAELAEKNVLISAREVSLLGNKFVVYLALSHKQCIPDMTKKMFSIGGYICHLDATCEGGTPMLMSSIDSLSKIVLGNIKMPSENEKYIVPFLEDLKRYYGTPLALVHDMGAGILKAVKTVFPGVPDYICHFHFLRDIGKDLLGESYDTIRKHLRSHQISVRLRYRAKQLMEKVANKPKIMRFLRESIEQGQSTCIDDYESLQTLNMYTLIHWVLAGKSEGQGYGFPFDCPHCVFAERIYQVYSILLNLIMDGLKKGRQGNDTYSDVLEDLKNIINDKVLLEACISLKKKKTIFEKLRYALRIAPVHDGKGLNDEGEKHDVKTIEQSVIKFRSWLTNHKDYSQDRDYQKLIAQLDKYWEKLFTDPISVQTPNGVMQILPQRTNNILEQFFRRVKRGYRRRTGDGSASRALRTMLAQTPLVQNLHNAEYMKILLNGKTALEEVFASIDVKILREEFRKAKDCFEKVPSILKPLVAMPDFPQKLCTVIKSLAV